jgi:5-methylthioribose kinase
LTDTPTPPHATTADYELLVDRDDVVRYLESVGLLSALAADPADVEVREVTAGNMNRVFIARGPLGGLAVKQAPPWVQAVGPEWPIDPVRVASEARAYETLARLVPESVPTVASVDLDRFVLVMEDLSDLDVLRDALVRQVADVVTGVEPTAIDFRELGAVVGRFSAELTLATSLVGLEPAQFSRLAAAAANPELCALTFDAVLDEPYRANDHNHWIPELDDEVRALYVDAELLDAVGVVQHIFATRTEALIHGDLHSGSLMTGRRGGVQSTKVFDPEFSFVGPIGMDLGLFWANMTIAAIAASRVGAHDLAASRASSIAASWEEFTRVVTGRWGERVGSPDDLDLADWLARIRSDAWRFAGVEAVRRVAGFSHAADVESLPAEHRASAYRELLASARRWIITGSPSVRVAASTLVLDLEGTTSAAGFILGDLYDYARPRLGAWLDDHGSDPAIAEARAQVVADAALPPDASTDDIVRVLVGWMADDVKATPLKTIQGQIWAEGFARDEISSHFFDDVIPRLREWSEAGTTIAVFSSGSVASQVPWFRHSPGGDLTPLIVDYFDTVKAGSKKESSSYDAIREALGRDAADIVFFTDHPDEVAAARTAGWQVVAFSRPGEPWYGAEFGDAPVVSSFDEVEVTAP